MKVIEQPPTTYEHWIDSGRIIVPCLKGTPIVPDWNSPNFKITKDKYNLSLNDYITSLLGVGPNIAETLSRLGIYQLKVLSVKILNLMIIQKLQLIYK